MTGPEVIDTLGEPYPGLRAFRRDETHIFFGRETAIDDMVERLAAHHFLAVTGLSGSGKSSLVATGLLDALDRGLLVEAGSLWRVAAFRPGDEPLKRLTDALIKATGAPADAEHAALTEAKLARGPRGLVEWLDEIDFPPKSNLLLLVDQFEEIFRYRHGRAADDLDAFVSLLLASAAQRGKPIYVVITMRSDFIGECAQFTGLAETINNAQYLTPRLNRDQCRQAIAAPAAVYGGKVEDALVTRLLNDMGGNPDQLPLMQHILMLLWDEARRRSGETTPLLTLADYERLGGIGTLNVPGATRLPGKSSNGALSDHADRVLAELTREQQRLAEILFRALTQGEGTGGRDVRRPISLADIAAIADVPIDKLIPVIEAFRAPGRYFLTPPAPEPLRPETVIDISHESLIRQWVKLRGWVQEEFQSAETYRGIERGARQWKARRGNLLSKLDLAVALKWRKAETPNQAWADRYGGSYALASEFLRKSRRHRMWRRGLASVAICVPIAAITGVIWMMYFEITTILEQVVYLNPGGEFSDFGVKPQAILKADVGTATPLTLPGAQVVGTLELRAAAQSGTLRGAPFILIDAWNDTEHMVLPGAQQLVYAGYSGSFQDDAEGQLQQKLKDLTGNKLDTQLVFYCLGSECWESYNACLRAIYLGYSRVYWYRGGYTAWRAADTTLTSRVASELSRNGLSDIPVDAPTVWSNIPDISVMIAHRMIKPAVTAQDAQDESLDANAYYQRSLKELGGSDQTGTDQAIIDLTKAIVLNNQNADYYFNRGQAYAVKGDYDDAMADLQQAAVIDPARAKDVGAALADPKYAIVYVHRGNDYYSSNEYDKALEAYNQAIALKADDAGSYNGRGNVYFSEGMYDLAIADYGKAIMLRDEDAVFYGNRGNAYIQEHKYDLAVMDYNAAIRLDPKNASYHNLRGVAYYNDGNIDRAILDYNQSIALKSDVALVYANRASAYRDKSDFDHALADFNTALKLDPKNATYFNLRGVVYFRKGDYDLAIADFSQSIMLKSDDPLVYSNRGNAYDREGQYDLAIASLDSAIKLDAKNAGYYSLRGEAYFGKGDTDHAIADYTQSIALKSNDASVYVSRGGAYLIKKDFDHALADADTAIGLQPSTGAYWLRGRTALYAGKGDLGAGDFAMAEQLNPKSAYFPIWLHIARLRAGTDDASELAANAGKLDPSMWPYPVVALFQGSLTPDGLTAAAKSDDATTQNNRMCEAGFYLGVYYGADGQVDLARPQLQLAADTCPKGYIEYQVAKIELDRLSQSSPALSGPK